MLDLVIYLAALLALLGLVFRRDRVTLALLVSLVAAEIMMRSGLSFHIVWWAMLDALVFLFIVAGSVRRRELYVLLLFWMAWPAYLLPQVYRDIITSLVVILQFILVTPWGMVWRRAKKTPFPKTRNPFDDFHLRTRT